MVKYRVEIISRIWGTDNYQVVYEGTTLWDSFDEAEEEGFDSRSHYKDRINVIPVKVNE